jgi:undecaprenyl-diphosphatase
MFTAAFYLLLARRWTACGIPLLAVALLTAWGRVYSGIHFPFDMAGSLAVGFISVGLTHLSSKTLNPLNERLIRIVDRLADRLVRMKKGTAKEK